MPENKLVKAGPTKAFFVKMLTRDIDLADAILDLLDNCVDGVVRQLAKKTSRSTGGKPYKGFYANITATKDSFEIADNCGGIPEGIAQDYAFMLGRPDLNRDSGIETVGMYGIGMKRAIFKLGQECVVESQPDTGRYKVAITSKWLSEDDNWDLELSPHSGNPFANDGTKISIKKLHKPISRRFNADKDSFLGDLHKEIARHYALILGKGFKVKLNGKEVAPARLSLLSPAKSIGALSKPSIEPYVFSGKFDGVAVDVIVGFYRPLLKEQELDDSLLKSTREHAGWTVVCNDRVVLYNDKSPKTGWGTGGVPSFHNQFISIAGFAQFRSNDSMALPLNTTKRGIDTSTDVYHIALDFMQEGLKKFTSFTYDWKRNEESTESSFRDLKPQHPLELTDAVKDDQFKTIRRHRTRGTGKYYSPSLPKPASKAKSPRVCFPATEKEIKLLAEHYFGDTSTERSLVGRRCFDESLELVREDSE